MKITLKNTSIIIDDYEFGTSTKLEDSFSIWDKINYTKIYKAIEYNEETKQLILPRGIDVSFVENCLNLNAKKDNDYDDYETLDNVKLKYLPRDEVQVEALKFMIGKDLYRHTLYKSQLSVNLPTGKGKSYCSIATMAYIGLKSAVITSNIGWLKQWKDYILEYTNIKSKDIYFITGSPAIDSLFRKNGSPYKIYLISHSTIRSYAETNGWDKITELFKKLKIGLKFYDESHLRFDNMCKIDFYTNTYKTYYVSATPARSNPDEDRIYQLYFKNIPSIDLFDENKDPHTNYIAIKYNSHPTVIEASRCKNRFGLDRNLYINQIVYNKNFYKLLTYLLDLVLKQQGKCLIYIGTNQAIDIVYNWIINNFPELYGNVGIYNSLVTGNKELALENKIILSTTKSLGAAVDIKDLKTTIVLAEPFSSEVIAKQTLGRTRNGNTFYIEVVDIAYKNIYLFYNKKKPIFSKYALSCKELNMNDIMLDNKYKEIMEKRSLPKLYNCINIINKPMQVIEEVNEFIPVIKFL